MLCGRPPFVADAPGRLMLKHIRDEPPPLLEREPSVPVDVAWVVHQCLAKEPEDRPRSARAVYTAFASATAWDGKLVEANLDGEAPDNTPTLVEEKFSQPTLIRGSSRFDPNSTTVGGAIGESRTEIVETGRRQKRLRWLALAIAVTSLAAVGITLLEAGHPAGSRTRPAAGAPPATREPSPAEPRKAPAPPVQPSAPVVDASVAAAGEDATAAVPEDKIGGAPGVRETTRKRRKTRDSPPKQAPPVEEKALPGKVKPRKIGEGTMEVDL